MKKALFLLFVGLIWLTPALAAVWGQDPTRTVVTVVRLDDQGRPAGQGLGVVVGKEGRILTSAALLGDKGRTVVKTSSGALRMIARVLQVDGLQDLALVQVEAGNGANAALGPTGRLRAGEQVWLPVRQGEGYRLAEARVVKLLPLSPRLTLLKLEPAGLEGEPGTPLFNRQGEVVGMRHAFGGGGDQEKWRFFLARDHTQLKKSQDAPAPTEGPGDPASSPLSRPQTGFWEGVAAGNRHAYQEAQEKFTAVLATDGDLPEAYYGRGVARYQLGDWAGAGRDFEAAIARLPGYALAWLWLGKVREKQQDRRAAQAAYEQAVAAAPDLEEAWFRLGELAYAEGRLDQAGEYLKRVGEAGAEAAPSWWYRGNIARRRQQPEEALRAFSRAVKLNPELAPAYLEGGKLLLLDLGRPQEAVTWLTRAVALEPGRALSRYYLALAQLTTWNPGGAWEQYFALQKIDPQMAARLAPFLE